MFGLVPSYGKAVKNKLHVNLVNVGTNAHSAMGSGVNPLSAEEEAWYQQEIEGIYDTFVGVVSDGRKMSREAVDDIAQGRVWSGKEALGIGLADEKGTLLDAIEYTAKHIKLSNYSIAAYPEKLSFKDQLRGKQEKKKDPLVWVKEHMHPGFNAMALMPYFTIDPVTTIE